MPPANLQPPLGQLGLEAPGLGAWFDDASIQLRTPGSDLSVVMDAASATRAWRAPATGVLGYHVATPTRPTALQRLRKPDGTPAFANGSLVALFTLLPEVEQRLAILAQGIPSADANIAAGGGATRPTVRHLAVEFTGVTADITLLEAVAAPPIGDTAPDATSAADKAAVLGLGVDADGSTLKNTDHPMTDLLVPSREAMVTIGNRAVSLWAFDDRGLAVDPGAVASWWNYMATVLFNMWAAGADQRTVTCADQLTVHFVNPAEGPADAPLLGLLNTTNLNGTGAIRTAGTNAPSVQFQTAGNDDSPKRLALLPNGSYQAAAVAPYAKGAVAQELNRDYVRVAIVDIELHLVGQPRTAPSGGGDEAERRAADQARATTRVPVNAVAAGGLQLHTTIDAAATALLSAFGTNPATLVLPTIDGDMGAIAVPTITATAIPPQPPTIVAQPLVGGGTVGANQRADDQRVLLQLSFAGWTPGGGEWVRVWPQGFDADRAVHVALDGGAGVALSDGTANVIVTLPDGVVDQGNAIVADSGCDVSVVVAGSTTPLTEVVFADVRFARPVPVGGSALDFAAASDVRACELAGAVTATTTIPSGSTLFAALDDGGFALIDPTTVPATTLSLSSLGGVIGSNDVVALATPAFVTEETGDVQAGADLPAAGIVAVAGRNGLSPITAAGVIPPTLERWEACVSSVATAPAAAAATITSVGLRHDHDPPPHQFGHPGAPAAREVSGAGVSVTGMAAVAVAEFGRDRVNPGTRSLVTAATTALPTVTAPTGASPWAAVLRTVGFGTDGEPGLPVAVRAVLGFPFSGTVEDVLAFLDGAVGGLPSSLPNPGDVLRAMSRRALAIGWGLRDVATSLDAAFRRAEDLVYVETPAIDTLAFGADGDSVNPVQSLVDRLAAQTALHVVLCLPRRSPYGWPAKLGRVRDALAITSIAALEAAGPGRVGVFHPAAGRDRALDLASTALVVDDVYALVGTSHLWRRGLCFDGGLAAAVFDERTTAGRPTAVQAFRQALVAQRLGAVVGNVPLDAAGLVGAVRDLAPADGAQRVTTTSITPPDPAPSDTDIDLWNRDGSPVVGFDPLAWLTGDANAQSEFTDQVP